MSGLQYMQAWAALHGNPQADLRGAFGVMQQVYGDALCAIPYLTGGRTGQELAQSERDSAVEKFKKYREETLKKAAKPRGKAGPRPVAAAKHRAGVSKG